MPPEATEPRIRTVFSIVARFALGIAVGGGMGAIGWWVLGGRAWHGFAIGSALGVFVWLPIGVFLWATFPYKSDSESDLQPRPLSPPPP
jgi:hypothetical protein